MKGVLKCIDEYNPGKKRKVLMMFEDLRGFTGFGTIYTILKTRKTTMEDCYF